MNCSTGHIVSSVLDVSEAERHKYTLLPGWMRKQVREALDGKSEVTIDLTANTPLAKWARQRVAKAEAKRLRKNAKRLSDGGGGW